MSLKRKQDEEESDKEDGNSHREVEEEECCIRLKTATHYSTVFNYRCLIALFI
jgi:hypothetical protein